MEEEEEGDQGSLPQDFLNVTLVYEDCSGSQVRPTGPQQMCWEREEEEEEEGEEEEEEKEYQVPASRFSSLKTLPM